MNSLAFTSYIFRITYLTPMDLVSALQLLHLYLLQSTPTSVI